MLDFGQTPYRSDEAMDSKADISELARLNWKFRRDKYYRI